MKKTYSMFALLVVLSVLVGRWYAGNLAAPTDTDPAAVGLRTQPKQPPFALRVPALTKPDKPGIEPDLILPLRLSGKPEVVHNTGPFVDADLDQLPRQPMGSNQPIRNSGSFVDAGEPNGSSR